MLYNVVRRIFLRKYNTEINIRMVTGTGPGIDAGRINELCSQSMRVLGGRNRLTLEPISMMKTGPSFLLQRT